MISAKAHYKPVSPDLIQVQP
jgi:hypothetical protein